MSGVSRDDGRVSDRPSAPPPLVGRSRVLARLGDALRAGRGVVIGGEAGIGKTSVARVLAAAAADDGFAVEPVVASDAAREVPLAAVAGLLPATAGADQRPLDRMRATVGELAARHGTAPVLLLVDDAHRLDPASAALLLYLVVHEHAQVLATVRSGEPVPDAFTRLWRDAGAERVDLPALSDGDVRAIVAQRLPGPVARPTLRWLQQATRGNPLHLDELLRAARDGGGLARVDGTWQRVGPVAPSPRLREIIDERLGRLVADEHRALALIALAEPLAVAVLESLDALAPAGQLEARGLVVADPDDPAAVRVAHPLHGEVVRARLGAIEGRELRRRLSAALPADQPAVRRRLAAWALEDGRDDDPDLLVAGLEDALARLDPEQAVAFGRAALAAGAGPAAVVPYATALRTTGAFAEAEHLLAAHEPALRDTPHAAAYAFNRAAGLQWGLRRQDDALALLRRVAPWRADGEWRATIHQIAASLLVTSGRLQDGIALAAPLIDLDGLSDPLRLRIMLVLGHALPLVGRPQEARDVVARTLDRCRPEIRIEWPYETTFAAIATAAGTGWADATRTLDAVRGAALEEDEEERAAYVEMHLARLANLRGDAAGAQRLAHDATERFTLMDPREHVLTCRAEQAIATVAAGRPADARCLLDDLHRRRRRWPISLPSAHRSALAEAAVLAAEGDPVAAQRRALAAADAAGDALLWEAEALFEHVRLGGRPSTVVARLGRLAAAAPDTIVGPWHRHVQALGSGPALEAAAATWVGVGALGWAGEAATAAIAAYAERDDPGSADRVRALAARLAADRGLPAASARAAHARAALRPREREVAQLVALRLTNAEIAERLSLSVRTVESHVYRASTRLGLRSRAELAAAVGDGVQ